MPVSHTDLILPEPLMPEPVGACFTTRTGGKSLAPYTSLNLAKHVGDSQESVEQNRQLLLDFLDIKHVCWLNQVHGDAVVEAEPSETLTADASWTDKANLACAIQVADCMPVLVSDKQGTKVGAAHAGWRGLSRGVIPRLIEAMNIDVSRAHIWLGPCIGQHAFEVGPEVRDAFAGIASFSGQDFDQAFIPGRTDRLHANLQKLAQIQLRNLGCKDVSVDASCTHTDSARFFSFRRDAVTGRMAALIWIKST